MSEKKYYYEPPQFGEYTDTSKWDSADWREWAMGPYYLIQTRHYGETRDRLAATDPDFRGFALDEFDLGRKVVTLANTTVDFSLDGADYEIDLTHEHAAELRAIFADYIQVARVVGSQVADAPAPPEA